jgi:ribosomal-protein-serine acetyltransferase
MTARLPVDDDLTLDPRHPSDANEMFAVVERHRASLREWLTWIDATRSLTDARRYAQFAQAQFESRVAFDYVVRSGGALVGAIGLHAVDWTSRSAQIGYWLAPDAVGRGICTRATAALASHAFGYLELNRLEIHCVVENQRSRAVAERLGFAFEGTLAEAYLLHGAFRDIALYATTASRWRGHRS